MLTDETASELFSDFVSETEPSLRRALSAAFGAEVGRATIWISGDGEEWTPVDISFSQWHSIVFVGRDAIYIRGAGAGTDTTHYWIGTFEQP